MAEGGALNNAVAFVMKMRAMRFLQKNVRVVIANTSIILVEILNVIIIVR
jgi:hypothetical protein